MSADAARRSACATMSHKNSDIAQECVRHAVLLIGVG
jgi:hypothetical protein